MDCQPAVVFGIRGRSRDSSWRSAWVAGAWVIKCPFSLLVFRGPCRRASSETRKSVKQENQILCQLNTEAANILQCRNKLKVAQEIQSHLTLWWQLTGQRGALTVRFRAHHNVRCCLWFDDWVGGAILFGILMKLYYKGCMAANIDRGQ